MTVPTQAIHSLHTVPKSIARKLPRSMSIHGLLAAELTLRQTISINWAELVPKWSDFEATIPFLWVTNLQRLLPGEAKAILTKQHTMFERDWGMFRNGFHNKSRQDYLYAWLFVNTRSFYHETATTLRYPWHDRLALLPVADLFNHTNDGCSVLCSTEDYTVVADRPYDEGAELFTSYGEHSNDYLLAEYGFILQDNQWDKLCLDDLILPKLNAKHKNELMDKGYMGDFMLHVGSQKHDAVWIALRLICSAEPHWQNYIDGEEDVEGTLAKAIELLPAVLGEYLSSIKSTKAEIQLLEIGMDCQRSLLARRWEQIEAMVKQAIGTTWFSV